MKRNCFIGIDISKKTLDVVIYDQEKKSSKIHFVVNNVLKGFKEMIKKIKSEGVNLNEVFVCLEYCGIYGLELGLFLDGKIDFCFCSPLHIKRSLGLTRGKTTNLMLLKLHGLAFYSKMNYLLLQCHQKRCSN